MALDAHDRGRDPAPKNKQDVLLCPLYGVSHLNLGRSAYLSGILDIYKTTVTRLQVTSQPISHRGAGLIRHCLCDLTRSFLGPNASRPKVLTEFGTLMRDASNDKGALADEIFKESLPHKMVGLKLSRECVRMFLKINLSPWSTPSAGNGTPE